LCVLCFAFGFFELIQKKICLSFFRKLKVDHHTKIFSLACAKFVHGGISMR